MKRIAMLAIVVALAASFDLSLPAEAQTAAQSGVKRKSPASHRSLSR
jgi:hypothetical protein